LKLDTEQLPSPTDIGNGDMTSLPVNDSRVHILFLMDELTEMGGA